MTVAFARLAVRLQDAESSYRGPKLRDGRKSICLSIDVESIKRSDVGRFAVLPERWIVAGTIGWLMPRWRPPVFMSPQAQPLRNV
jgi:hypothetical protein